MENYRSTSQREFLNLFRAGRVGQGKGIALARFFRRNARSEGAAEGGVGGNSAAPERSAGAKRRRVNFPQNVFAQSLEYPISIKKSFNLKDFLICVIIFFKEVLPWPRRIAGSRR